MSASAPELLGPAEVRELAAQLGVTPTKKLGQNFVHDANTVRKIVRAAGVTADSEVLEIGPGLGSLTLGITATGARVTAVEIDPPLAQQLPETVRRFHPEARLEVVNADGMRVTELPHPPDTLVANLPYNVSVPILMHLLETFPTLERALVMVQYEVGERIAAAPGSKAYGAPSAKAAWYGDWSLAGMVSRQIFWPVPGVDSVLVRFEKAAEPLGTELERRLAFALITAAFGQRRKMLRRSLQQTELEGALATAVGPEKLRSAAQTTAVLAAAGIAATARAEELSVRQFLAIARQLLAG